MKLMKHRLEPPGDREKSPRRRRLPALLALTALFCAGGVAWAQGSAYFNYPIHWVGMPDLYFTVAGGPPNTCGDAVITRNGVTSTAVGWLCTDASGNATKGPWSWANQPIDETATTYIRWPGGGITSQASHIWDKTAPSASITSPLGSPPSSYSGTGSDAAWGAGFNTNWTIVRSNFLDVDTDLYWTPSLGAYAGSRRCRPVGGGCNVPSVDATVSGMPGFSISWNSAFPPASAHTPGHAYKWTTCVWDGGQWGCVALNFTAQ